MEKPQDSLNTFILEPTVMMWPEAHVSHPPKNPLILGTHAEWMTSDLVWIRVSAIFKKDKDGNSTEEVLRPAYTALGKCVWPKIPVAHHPKPKANKDNPATFVEWGEDEPHYEVRGVRVDATHWYPCQEPAPPGTLLPAVTSSSSNIIYSGPSPQTWNAN